MKIWRNPSLKEVHTPPDFSPYSAVLDISKNYQVRHSYLDGFDIYSLMYWHDGVWDIIASDFGGNLDAAMEYFNIVMQEQ